MSIAAGCALFVWSTAQGVSVPLQITVLRCTARKRLVFATYVGNDDPQAIVELSNHLRCARPGEPLTK